MISNELLKENVKIVFIDIDNTLYSGKKGYLPPENIRTINKLTSIHNINIVISTGRNLETSLPILNKFIKSEYMKYAIVSSGGKIYDFKNGKVIYNRPLGEEISNNLLNYFYDKNICYKFSYLSTFFRKRKFSIFESRIVKILFPKLQISNSIKIEEVDFSQIHKVIVFLGFNSFKRKKLENNLMEEFSDRVNIVEGGSKYFLELTEKPISKGYAAKKIMKNLGLDSNSAMALGDSLNDFELFKAVKYKFSPSKSNKELLKISDGKIKKASKGGVSKKLEEIFNS